MSETILKQEERIAFALRALYRKYGYLPYNMSKFEPYDLYSSNKDFLVGDGVITFNDAFGKLLALKPDVTLSIIKNAGGENCKVYYHENVYRISGATKEFKELMQVGLERIGEKGVYALFETAYLAAASLNEISSEFVLDISHLGILSATLEALGEDRAFERQIMQKLAEKNVHEMLALCQSRGIDEKKTDVLLSLVKTYGDMQTVLEKLAPLCESGKAKEAYEELKAVCALLAKTEFADKIRIDFSVVNDMKYYNGLVFKGFVGGVCEGVLSGGQYDRLMARMGRKTGAIGFAVYLDLLEDLRENKRAYDMDLLVLYDENTDPALLAKTVQKEIEAGKSVSAQKEKGKLRFFETLDLCGRKES